MAGDDDEALRRYLSQRDAAWLRGSRTLGGWVGTALVIVLLMAVPLVPAVAAVLPVAHGTLLAVLAVILVSLTHSTFAFCRGGVDSRWFRLGATVDALAICGGSLALIYLANEAGSIYSAIFWLWYVAFLLMNTRLATVRRIHMPMAVGAPLALAAALWLVRGEPEAAAVALFLGMPVAVIYSNMQAETRSGAVRVFERLRIDAELARKRERARIARDLHDGLGADLAAILWCAREQLGADANGASRQAFEEVATAAKVALEELRELVLGLSEEQPWTWNQLVAHLRERGARLCGVELHFELTADEPEVDILLGAAARMHLTRAVLEALRNAVRHAGATRARVELTPGESVRVAISDDGRGIDDAAQQGHGLENLRARAHELGAELAIDTGDAGTRIELCIPRHALAPAASQGLP